MHHRDGMNGPYYGFPGCPNPSYGVELSEKQALLESLFGQRVPTLAGNPVGYRNKIEFSCTPQALGLKRTWDFVVDVEHCPILDERLTAVWKKLRACIRKHNMPCFDITARSGWLRYVTLRVGVGVQLAVTTTSSEHAEYVALLSSVPGVTSTYWFVNADREGVQGELQQVVGDSHLVMPLAGKEFLVRPESFFQANTLQTERAINLMREHVSAEDSVLDLYCGVGSLGQCLPHKSLVGIEENEVAVELARMNAQRNACVARYISASSAQADVSCDVAIVDPPRSGLQSAVHTLLFLQPKKIVYLSCNPKTARRDLAALRQSYRLRSIHGIDFFPRTPHVECLLVLDNSRFS